LSAGLGLRTAWIMCSDAHWVKSTLIRFVRIHYSYCPFPYSICQYPYSNCQYPYSNCPYPYSMCQYPYSHYRRLCPSHSTAPHSAHARGSGGPSPGVDVAGVGSAAPHTCSLSDQVVPCLGHELLEHTTTKHNTTLS
jgi:hypothetical protein